MGNPHDDLSAYIERHGGVTRGEAIRALGGQIVAAWDLLTRSGRIVRTGAHRQAGDRTEPVYAVGREDLATVVDERYSAGQPRDKYGKWTGGLGGAAAGDTGGSGSGSGGSGSGGSGGGSGGDAAFEQHTADVEARVGDALAHGQATDARYAADSGKGAWDPKRAAVHKEIVNDLYGQAKGVPNEGRAVVAGGLGGAGKSTVLGKYAHIDKSKYLTLNPDDVKEVMGARGLIPKIKGLSPMEAAALVHEESSHITNLLAKRAYADNKNVIWDITMASRGSVQRRLDEMKAAGYGNVRGVFVDIPVETSVSRAMARYKRGKEAYDAGQGLGGRYVPPSIIRKNASPTASSVNRETFDALRGQFNAWSLYDNSGSSPTLVSQSK